MHTSEFNLFDIGLVNVHLTYKCTFIITIYSKAAKEVRCDPHHNKLNNAG